MITFLQAFILSVVEGITEFLPISSTGHLILTSNLLNLERTAFLGAFEIFIQGGAILAVVALYKDKFKDPQWIRLSLLGFLPAAIMGLLLKDRIDTFLSDGKEITLISLFVGGVILILFDYFKPQNKNQTYPTDFQALIIGLAQTAAFIPGVSRSAATIIAGVLLGLPKKEAVEFSFYVSVPTILAASIFSLTDVDPQTLLSSMDILIFSAIVSFITALIAIKTFIAIVKDQGLKVFGFYRILLSVLYPLLIK